MSTTGEQTIKAIIELENQVEALTADRGLNDHAFWLHVDLDVINECVAKLNKMGAAIEGERYGTGEAA